MNFYIKYISKLKYFIVFVLLCAFFSVNAQSAFNLNQKKSSKIRFQLINNLIILPVEINGIELSFVLDTGVNKPILFNLTNVDSLEIRNSEKIYLRGLGADGLIEALKSKNNFFKVGDAININQDIYVVFNQDINFSPRLGVAVHGIIGYDVFKDFIVELNYSNKFIRLHQPRDFKFKTSKKWETIPIEIYQNKPFINAQVKQNNKTTNVKLLMDTGGSDAIWLFEHTNKDLSPAKDKQFKDFLGIGLSGSVYGVRSKLENFTLSEFRLQELNVAYPDSTDLSLALNHKERNGSIGGNILKRFNYFIDYKNGKIQIKKNSFFKEPFYYNNSGITLEQNGMRVVKKKQKKIATDAYNQNLSSTNSNTIELVTNYAFELYPAYEIVELRETSNAYFAGLKIGDVITSINGKDAESMTLQDINSMFYNREGEVIKMRIERDGIDLYFKFSLDNVFNQKKPSN